jgi:hypothetical protein
MSDERNLPWTYRPRHFDDWGWIRDASGDLAACARGEKGGKTHDEHRADKTDPYGDYAAFIVEAVNSHDALVAENAKLREQLGKAIAERDAEHQKNIDWAKGNLIAIRERQALEDRLNEALRCCSPGDQARIRNPMLREKLFAKTDETETPAVIIDKGRAKPARFED